MEQRTNAKSERSCQEKSQLEEAAARGEALRRMKVEYRAYAEMSRRPWQTMAGKTAAAAAENREAKLRLEFQEAHEIHRTMA
eukprot:6808525-Pyramimonas_sp.AAC.1